MNIPDSLRAILSSGPVFERAYIVGGAVRDWVTANQMPDSQAFGLEPKDFDVEVYGVSYTDLVSALEPFGKVDLIGRSFGIAKVTIEHDCYTCRGVGNLSLVTHGDTADVCNKCNGAGWFRSETFDFSIPRWDSRMGVGHKGFDCTFDPEMTLVEGAMRRDFTINSLAWDPEAECVVDPTGRGIDDIEAGILRAVSPAFSEDPLRVLRGMQFAGRFNMTMDRETRELCTNIRAGLKDLPVERVWEEWKKWASKSTVPSAGMTVLRDTGWVADFKELYNLLYLKQDPEWHPEGDVFTHTCHCVDALALDPEWQALDEEDRVVVMLAVLCHDMGKATTSAVREDGRIVSPGHDKIGATEQAPAFLARIGCPPGIAERVCLLVGEHMAHLNELNARSVRRLSSRLHPENIVHLAMVMRTDASGRPPIEPDFSRINRLEEIATEVGATVSAVPAILMGRHLIRSAENPTGWEPGKAMGAILRAAYEAQMDGAFSNLQGAFEWVTEYICDQSGDGCEL